MKTFLAFLFAFVIGCVIFSQSTAGRTFNVQNDLENIFSNPKPPSDTLRSPVIGKVIEIKVSVGQKVNQGEVAFILEVMKMEVPIECEKNGEVKEIWVIENQIVNKGDILMIYN